MAKKRDILSNYFKEFPEFNNAYKARLNELKRDFNNEKITYKELLKEVDSNFSDQQEEYFTRYINEEFSHDKRKDLINDDYKERFDFLHRQLLENTDEFNNLVGEENKIYEDILNQFEERKQEALNKYLELIHESDKLIDESVSVHHRFIEQETLSAKEQKEYYQEINNFLANDLLNTMEKAKNSLDSLNDTLKELNLSDSKELNQTVLKSLEDLRGTQIGVISLFKDNSTNLEIQRESIKKISKNKQTPHSDLNQEMIQKYVVQIREINNAKITFEAKVKTELVEALERIHIKIVKADEEKDNFNLKKYILQKEIIEKKAEYLLHRNHTLANFTISKYQQEIKKIKIDSFKRSEEIKLAYSVPITFLQNSIDTYSNFAFYLNQGFDELDRLLNGLLEFHQEYTDLKNNFVTTTSKAYEDYKINLMVRINEVTNNLTKLISKIDDVSLEIVTLESKRRVEIAEIKKKIENLDILGDYQKYLASLENDEFFAAYQHEKNLQRIQIRSNYQENLLKINYNVLELNKNKEMSGEHLQYMLLLSNEEEKIHKLNFDKIIAQNEMFFKQQNELSFIMYKIAKLQIINKIKSKNYYYAVQFKDILSKELTNDQSAYQAVKEFEDKMEGLKKTNASTTSTLVDYLNKTDNNMSYLTIVEKNRLYLKQQIDEQTKKKISTCYQALESYILETKALIKKFDKLVKKYINEFKKALIYNENHKINFEDTFIKARGFSLEVSTLLTYTHNQATQFAYKYQVPSEIENLAINYEQALKEFNVLNEKIFSKFKQKTKSKAFYKKLQDFIIPTLSILTNFKESIIKSCEVIRDRISENDMKFIANAKIIAEDNKNLIDKEYDELAYNAVKIKDKRKKQIKALIAQSNSINSTFTDRITKLNQAYLLEKAEKEEFLAYLKINIENVIIDNDRQLLKMLNLIDQELVLERIAFAKQNQKYINTLKSIKASMSNVFESEVKYLYDLNYKREEDINKTIIMLQNDIDKLPQIREDKLLDLDKDKLELFDTKQNELIQKLSEIEGNKLLAKPELMDEIKAVDKSLPEEYEKLYREVSELENEFLQQFTLINEDYYETYQDYMNKQYANKMLIEDGKKTLKSFDRLNTYHKDLWNIFQLNYKETLKKSLESRDMINEERRKSKEKQDRIINA